MIIDTTCSVIERKMKEPRLEIRLIACAVTKQPTFKTCVFTITEIESSNISITSGGSTPVIFDGDTVFNGDVTFNDGVSFNGNVRWNTLPKTTNWDAPVPKATPEDMKNIQEQLARVANDPNLTITTGGSQSNSSLSSSSSSQSSSSSSHTFRYAPTPGKFASLPEPPLMLTNTAHICIQDYDSV